MNVFNPLDASAEPRRSLYYLDVDPHLPNIIDTLPTAFALDSIPDFSRVYVDPRFPSEPMDEFHVEPVFHRSHRNNVQEIRWYFPDNPNVAASAPGRGEFAIGIEGMPLQRLPFNAPITQIVATLRGQLQLAGYYGTTVRGFRRHPGNLWFQFTDPGNPLQEFPNIVLQSALRSTTPLYEHWTSNRGNTVILRRVMQLHSPARGYNQFTEIPEASRPFAWQWANSDYHSMPDSRILYSGDAREFCIRNQDMPLQITFGYKPLMQWVQYTDDLFAWPRFYIGWGLTLHHSWAANAWSTTFWPLTMGSGELLDRGAFSGRAPLQFDFGENLMFYGDMPSSVGELFPFERQFPDTMTMFPITD